LYSPVQKSGVSISKKKSDVYQVGSEMHMKRLIFFLACIIGLMAIANYQTLAGNKPPVKGDVLPPFELVAPADSGSRSYLGVTGGKRFTIPQIKAQVVIIGLFSRY
jgi:hypothetical protein